MHKSIVLREFQDQEPIDQKCIYNNATNTSILADRLFPTNICISLSINYRADKSRKYMF